MALPTPFAAKLTATTLSDGDHYVATPAKTFDHLGALAAVGEDEGDFDDYCRAIHLANERCAADEELAEAIAVLLNRAHAHGTLKQASV